MRPAAVELRTGAQLADALDRGLLTVLYQPVIELESGAVVAAEALARLREPWSGVLIPPSAFVPLAEATGLIGRLDREVAAIAIPQAAVWQALLTDQPFRMAINVSTRELNDHALPDRLAALAQEVGLPMQALILEVTETVLCSAGHGHSEVLRRLAALEVNVTLDDFGTGYSSLTHLLRFPVAGVKIDRSFVKELGTPGRGERIAKAVVRLGEDIGVHVVAEGVETAEQLGILRDLGCPYVQGYLLGRPMPAEQVTALLLQTPLRLPRPRLAAGE